MVDENAIKLIWTGFVIFYLRTRDSETCERLFKLVGKIIFLSLFCRIPKEKRRPGVNFINVLRAPFLYKSLWAAFFPLTFWLWIFGANFLCEKCARKMLMKLTTGVNFINILRRLFANILEPKITKLKR